MKFSSALILFGLVGKDYFLWIIHKFFFIMHSRPENIKNSRQKNSWIQINHFFWQFLTFSQLKKSWFLVIFEMAKNGICSQKKFVKLIDLISRVFFWPGLYQIYWPIVKLIYLINVFFCSFFQFSDYCKCFKQPPSDL